MRKHKLTKWEKIKIFLNEYFLGYGFFFSLLRIIGGPLILIMGLNLYFYGNTKSGIGYAGFMIAFGVYYLLKPLIIILTQKAWFKNFDLDYHIDSEKIVVQSDKSKSDLNYSELASVLKRKKYFALRTKSKQGFYLLNKFLEPAEINILEGLIKTNGNNIKKQYLNQSQIEPR